MRPGVIDPHLNSPLTCTKYPESLFKNIMDLKGKVFPREYTPEVKIDCKGDTEYSSFWSS